MKKKLISIWIVATVVAINSMHITAAQSLFPKSMGLEGAVIAANVNVRTAPNINSNILGQLSNEPVQILGQSESWYKINYYSQEAWIHKDYVEEQYGELIPTNKVVGEDIVNYGLEFIGTPYVWGGNDLKRGVDCSGLTFKIYTTYGIPISRVSYQQVEEGIPITKEELETGDLVFFNTIPTDRAVSHVGIYIDDNRFLHSDGTHGVMISSLDNNYYRSNYVQAVRIIN